MVAAQSMGGSTVSQDAWQLGKGFLPWAWATTAVPQHVYEIKSKIYSPSIWSIKSLDFRAINKLDTEVLSSDLFNTIATVFITVSQWLQSKLPVGVYSVIIAVYRNYTLLTDFREEYLRTYLSYYTNYSYCNLLVNSHINALLHLQHVKEMNH